MQQMIQTKALQLSLWSFLIVSLFTFTEIRDNFDTLLVQWLNLEDRENKGEEIKNVCRLPNSCVPREFENLFYTSTFPLRVPIVSPL